MSEQDYYLSFDEEELIKEKLAKRLKSVISQKQLRKAAIYNQGVITKSSIEKYMSSSPEQRVMPNIRTLIPLSRFLEVPLDYLLGEDIGQSTNLHSSPSVNGLFFNLYELVEELGLKVTTSSDGVASIEIKDNHISEFLMISKNKSVEQLEELLNVYKNYVIIDKMVCSDNDFDDNVSGNKYNELRELYCNYGITDEDKNEYPDECIIDIENRKKQWDKATPEERKQLLCELTDK